MAPVIGHSCLVEQEVCWCLDWYPALNEQIVQICIQL